MILAGRKLELNLDMFGLLLIANTIVYSAYVGGGRGFSFFVPGILYLLLIITFLIFPLPGTSTIKQPPQWFNALLYFGPIISTLIVSIFSVTLISWLRSTEYQTTQRQLELLGTYEALLATSVGQHAHSRAQLDPEEYSEVRFQKNVQSVLSDLCNHGPIFWYHSACMWLIKSHKDKGLLLLPGAVVNFSEAAEFKAGINATEGFLANNEFVSVSSMKQQSRVLKFKPRFRANLDAPAAFVPLQRGGTRVGILAIYGREGVGPPPQKQDKAFLESLASIISNTMEQWEGRFNAFPQREMNELFKCESLDDVFRKVVAILQKYLLADACEVVFRPDGNKNEMRVVSALGFTKKRVGIEYEVGRGRTGECAQQGVTIRFDDVRDYEAKGFDANYFKTLQKTHGRPVVSWMAIPIGGKRRNHGLIKVINRRLSRDWFTDEDQALGEDLALRLQVIIEKFLYIQETEDARREAEEQAKAASRHAAQASVEQKRAEVAAHQRQTDLMTMTHQLQGPLNPVIGALSSLQMHDFSRALLEDIEFAKALAESCLTLCWGTSATFAKLAGQQLSLSFDEVDAPIEMRRLCRMLQLTNTDNELTFRYREDPNFPKLRIDPAVFASVLFSLIHNAMKYAERFSTVYLECTFERDTGEAALKVKSVGVRIYEDERDRIFKPFERGKALKHTSLKYSGTGLGLWVARELMLSAGGNLTVELSDAHPDLSVFVVHIPRFPEQNKPLA